MKTMKFILTTLLFLASFDAEAQNVVIYKDGNIVKEYTAEQVDSVVYVPAKEVKFYYYVGTEKPTTDSDIEAANMISEDKITTFDVGNSLTEYKYFCYPIEWGEPQFSDPLTGDPMTFSTKVSRLSGVSLSKYEGVRIGKTGSGAFNVSWK